MTDYVVFVAYSQLHLAPAGVSPIFDPRQPLTLTSVTDAGRGLIIHTGINMGRVRVRILVDLTTGTGDQAQPDGEPSAPEGLDDGEDGWEKSVARMDVTETLYLTSPTVETDNFWPVFEPSRPGPYDVTVLAQGRSADPGGIAQTDEPCEDYRITFTPSVT